MKEAYEKAEMEIIRFDGTDVIVTSDDDPNAAYEEVETSE